ncbi:phosphotransferase [Streptomyces sp. NPDC127091]|uniref:phosphotransferase n=1 Tax=Streptomyces sp. NPDC127091 TaxID=3347134 RepID=UPI003656C6A0
MHVSDLNAPWVEKVLTEADGFDISGGLAGIEVTPIGTGKVADSCRLTLDYADTSIPSGSAQRPASIVAKVSSAADESRGAGRTELNYLREVRFYEEVAPQLKARVPACYYSEICSNHTEFVLLLEDLSPVRPGNQLEGCTVEETALALRQAAGFHAPYWGGEELRGLSWLDISASYWQRFEEMMPVWFEGFTERYQERFDPADLELAGTFVARIADYYARLRQIPFTIQHGDFRPDNVLFDVKNEPGTLAVVDWQTVILGPASVDVAYFIGGALDTETRRANEDQLLRGYHQNLCDLGVTDYPYERLESDYAVGTFGNLVIGVAAAMLLERSEAGDDLFVSMVTNAVHHARDRGGLAAMGVGERATAHV